MTRPNQSYSAATAPSIEQSVKAQYARVFGASDWQLFKRMADALFREAAFIKTKDMRFMASERLLARNARKRLLLGVGTELLLKSIYLKKGFGINKTLSSVCAMKCPFRLCDIDAASLDGTNTFQLAKLIDHLGNVLPLNDREVVLKGLRIAKVFRNKEGHVVVPSHKYNATNYRDVEAALVSLYAQGFGQGLSVHFSLEPNEAAAWRISSPNRVVHWTRARAARSTDHDR